MRITRNRRPVPNITVKYRFLWTVYSPSNEEILCGNSVVQICGRLMRKEAPDVARSSGVTEGDNLCFSRMKTLR